MPFAFGQTVFRDRRALIADPYNPGKQIREGEWGSTVAIAGAYLDPASSSAIADETRSQLLSTATLFADANVDVVVGDRIRVGGTEGDLDSGVAYLVEARPAVPVNPFTGWQPAAEIPLTLVEG